MALPSSRLPSPFLAGAAFISPNRQETNSPSGRTGDARPPRPRHEQHASLIIILM
jgi:hypothetical protein